MRKEIKIILDQYLDILSKIIDEEFFKFPLNDIIITEKELKILPNKNEDFIDIQISSNFHEDEINYFVDKFPNFEDVEKPEDFLIFFLILG